MYNVDTSRIERQLLYLQTCLDVLRGVHDLAHTTDQFAAARALHVAIECVTDVGNALIDGFIMRDPGSYEDIVEILYDEKVLAKEEAVPIKRLVECRRLLVINYTEVDKETLMQLLEAVPALARFPQRVEAYLKQELGPNALTFHA